MDEHVAEKPGPLGKHFKPLGMGSDMAPSGQNSAARRTSARTILEERVAQHRRWADGLESLLKALPLELPPRADEALWDLVYRARP